MGLAQLVIGRYFHPGPFRPQSRSPTTTPSFTNTLSFSLSLQNSRSPCLVPRTLPVTLQSLQETYTYNVGHLSARGLRAGTGVAGSMPEEVAEVPPVVIISEPAPAPPVPQPDRQEAQPLPVAATLDVSSILCIEGAPEDDDEDDDDDGDMEDGPRLKNSKLGVCKKAWTAAEDKILQEVVEKNGAHRWSTVAGYLPGRMGKQCRERCARHVAPSPPRPA